MSNENENPAETAPEYPCAWMPLAVGALEIVGWDGYSYVDREGRTYWSGAEPNEADAQDAVTTRREPVATEPQIADAQDRLLDAYTRVELLNITPAGAVKLAQLMQAGNAKALAIAEWVDAHWAEFRTKQAAIAAGNVGIDITPSVPWKPFSYAETVADE